MKLDTIFLFVLALLVSPSWAFNPYGVVTDGSRSEYDMHDDLADLIKVGGMGYERVDWDWRACQKEKDGAFEDITAMLRGVPSFRPFRFAGREDTTLCLGFDRKPQDALRLWFDSTQFQFKRIRGRLAGRRNGRDRANEKNGDDSGGGL